MSIFPAKHTLKIWKGSTFFEVFTRYDDCSDTPFDFCYVSGSSRISAYTAEMIIRDKPEGTPLFTLSTANNRIVFPTETNNMGEIRLIVDATDTAALTWKHGVYDLTVTQTNISPNITDALLYGAINVSGI